MFRPYATTRKSAYFQSHPDRLRVTGDFHRTRSEGYGLSSATQELGFALSEVKELLALRVQTGATCADVRQHTNTKITNIQAKIRDLGSMKAALERLAASCAEAGPVGDCPILDYLDEKESSSEC